MTATNTHYTAYSGGRKTVIHCIANDTIIVAGNSSTSNLTSNSSETVITADIASVAYGSQAGTWLLLRSDGTANLVVGAYYGSGRINYAADDLIPLSVYNTANLTVQLVGTANGSIEITLHKKVTFS